jgi:hypothetical protein
MAGLFTSGCMRRCSPSSTSHSTCPISKESIKSKGALIMMSATTTQSILSPAQIAEDAFIYGFPLIMNYGIMYAYSVNPNSGQYKAPFNQIFNEANVFTPKDTAVITPNSDTPYSMLFMDLRAEPVVLSVPDVETGRYYTVQIADLYTHNYAYVGSRYGQRGWFLHGRRSGLDRPDAARHQESVPVRNPVFRSSVSYAALWPC